MPDAPNGSGVVILPDVRGLYRFYEELALRFAERGYAAVAFDYFGRTAGVGEARATTGTSWPHVEQTTPEQIRDDTAAAVAHLRAAGAQSVFAVGFCFGGRMSWLAAADGHGLAGAVGFYGKPGRARGAAGPGAARGRDRRADPRADGGRRPGDPARTRWPSSTARSQEAGVEHEVVTYEGAPHSFFDRKQEEFADASEDAWRRTLDFLERHAR